MTRRLFWVAVGATAGILVARRVSRTVKRLSPPAVAGSLTEALEGVVQEVRGFVTDVRAISAEREADLQDALGLSRSGVPQQPEPELTEHLMSSGKSA